MPKKQSNTPPAGKPKRSPVPRRAAKEPAPGQAYLFEDQPVAEAPKKNKPAAAGKPEKSRATVTKPPAESRKKPTNRPAITNTKEYIQKFPYASVLVVGYVALVLAWDAFVTIGDIRTVNWAVFQWRPVGLQALLESLQVPHALVGWMSWALLTRVDLFKLLFWLALPMGICLWHMDWDYFRTRRIKRSDWWFLSGMCALAVGAAVSIRFIPALANQYRGLGQAAFSMRFQFFFVQILWVFSWLPGWEFMHRYFLLRRVSIDFPRFGWLLVPLSEGTYHLVVAKPWPETVAMVAFSVLMTQYALRRKSLVIPFLAHLAVEVFLIVGMVIWQG